MEKPLVSIIVPCYNTGLFIGETIRSVLAQTYSNIELIIVNDGSTDNSEQVIKSFTDERIKYISQENMGLSAARNTGIKNSNGNFISFLDADDLLLINKTQVQIDYFSKHPSWDMITCNFIRTDEAGQHLYSITKPAQELKLSNFLQGNQIHVPSALIRKETINKAGWFDVTLRAAEDYDYWCRIALNGANIFHLSEPLCTYRLLDNAMTANAPRQTEMLLKVVKKNFSSPLIPEDLKHLEENAVTSTLLTGAARCFVLKFYEEGKTYLDKALEFNSKISNQDFDTLSGKIAGMLVHMNVKDKSKKAKEIQAEVSKKFKVSKSFHQKIIFRSQLILKKNSLPVLLHPKNFRFNLNMLLTKIQMR